VSREIPTTQYMVDGWDRGPIGCHPYKRGSRHNRIGMWLMWIFYGIIIVQLLHAFTIIPFFPITFTILLGLLFIVYVAWRAS